MLSLTFRDGDSVKIGDDVVVYVRKGSRSNLVRLDFDAPLAVKILRDGVEPKTEERKTPDGD